MNDLITEYLERLNPELKKAANVQDVIKIILEDYDEFQKKERVKSLMDKITRKPKWLFNSLELGPITLYQNLGKIEAGFTFDSGYDISEKPILVISLLFWSIEITFGK